MGLLEKLLARLDEVNERLARLEGAATDTSSEDASGADNDAGISDGAVTLDKDGIPWDDRIHAGTKTTTAKGIWTRKKGITDDLYNSVVAELKATYGTADNAPATSSPAASAKPGAPAAPAKPGAPAAPAKPGAPAAPAKPGAPAANNDKSAAVLAINKLTAKGGYEVKYDVIWAMLQGTYGVDTFDALPAEHYPTIKVMLETWLETLSRIQDEINALNALANAHTDSAQDIAIGIETYLTNFGGDGVTLGSVPKDNIDQLLTDLSAYADQWEEFFKG